MIRIANILLFYLLFHVSLVWATSTISFEGGEYVIEVVVSDTKNSVANVRIFRGEVLLLSVEGKELRKVSCSLEKQTLHFIIPAENSRHIIELKADGDLGTLILEGEKIPLKSDWTH